MRKIVITVGQFIHRKGFDVLINAWAKCDKEYALYIIGAEPTKEYLNIKEKLNLANVHFEGFKAKVNCTPFVRQYGILFRKWGVFVCQRDNESTTELKR